VYTNFRLKEGIGEFRKKVKNITKIGAEKFRLETRLSILSYGDGKNHIRFSRISPINNFMVVIIGQFILRSAC